MTKENSSEYKESVGWKIAAVAACILAVISIVLSVGPKFAGGQTGFTENTQTSKYTDSSDWKNNVQATSERMASGTQYQILQAGSNGVMERVLPSSLAASDWTFAGLIKIQGLVETGATTTFTASSTAMSVDSNRFTAASFCDQKLIPVVLGNTTTAVLYMPTPASLIAACLPSDGICRSANIYNTETVSTTSFAEDNASSTIKFTSTTAFAALEEVNVEFCRWNRDLITFKVNQTHITP